MKKISKLGFPIGRTACLSFLILLLSFEFASAQDCPNLVFPLDGSANIVVDATIEWEAIAGVPGYLISLGTTPNGTDILNNQTVGGSNFYRPPTGLPENTRIYVTLTLFFFNQPNIICSSQSFTTGSLTAIPDCSSIIRPTDGGLDINAATNFTWSYSPEATGYRIILGTSPNGSEILDEDVGNVLQYTPALNLPLETTFYLSVIPYNRLGQNGGCSAIVFSTGPAATLPPCTFMTYPQDQATNVPLSPTLEWMEVPEATGYRINIGSSPFNSDILDNAVLTQNFTSVLNFEPNRTFYITISPFNSAGVNLGCTQETFSTILGCGPYIDPISGDVVILNPTPTLPEDIFLCRTTTENSIVAPDIATGFRWYKLDAGSRETLISSTEEVKITDAGDYRYELYDIIEDSGDTVECANSMIFTVEFSEEPVIETIIQEQRTNGYDFEIETQGNGNYEYALDNRNGPYQASNTFTNIPPGIHTFYVRDINGCGIAEETISQDLTVEGFPKFFTPNGDGANDYWQFIPAIEDPNFSVSKIFIFNRYGNLIAQVLPNSLGWNGMANGRPMPQSDYWFRAVLQNNKEVKGHFTLKR